MDMEKERGLVRLQKLMLQKKQWSMDSIWQRVGNQAESSQQGQKRADRRKFVLYTCNRKTQKFWTPLCHASGSKIEKADGWTAYVEISHDLVILVYL
jgi:hypothetical protein